MTIPNDIDSLMQRIEEINAKEPPLAAIDIDTLIALHRHRRSLKQAGRGKVKQQSTVNLDAIMGGATKPAAPAASETRALNIKVKF